MAAQGGQKSLRHTCLFKSRCSLQHYLGPRLYQQTVELTAFQSDFLEKKLHGHLVANSNFGYLTMSRVIDAPNPKAFMVCGGPPCFCVRELLRAVVCLWIDSNLQRSGGNCSALPQFMTGTRDFQCRAAATAGLRDLTCLAAAYGGQAGLAVPYRSLLGLYAQRHFFLLQVRTCAEG